MTSLPPSPTSLEQTVRLLRELEADGFTGSVRGERDGVIKVLYLSDGRLACASSTDRRDGLGVLLEADGRITAEQHATAQDRALPGEALGAVLINLGYIEAEDLLHGARLQLHAVLGSMVQWAGATFRTRTGPLPERAINLEQDLAGALLHSLLHLPDDGPVRAWLGPGNRVLRVAPDLPGTGWPEEALRLRDLLDGSRDLDTACRQAGSRAACMALGLKALGVLQEGAVIAASAFPDRSAAATEPALRTPVQDPTGGGTPPHEDEPAAAPVRATAPSCPDPPKPMEAAGAGRAAPGLPFEDGAEAGHHLGEALDGAGTGELRGFDEPGGQAAEADEDVEPEVEPEEELDDTEDLDDPLLGPPPASPVRRGWMLGAALPLLLLLAVFLFSGGDDPPDLEPSGDSVTAQALPATLPPSLPAGEDPGSPEPPATPVVPDPTPPDDDVALPPPDRTLKAGAGPRAGLEAFQAGDFARAVEFWRQDRRGKDGYTLQVMVACERPTLDHLRQQIQDPGPLFLAPVEVRSGTCFKVLWGTYASRAEAESAASRVPPLFTAGGDRPWAVPLSSLG